MDSNKSKNSDLVIIRKKYGEKMAHFCRSAFPTLLEEEGLLSRLILEHFNESHYLYQDLVFSGCEQAFKDYIYGLVSNEKKKRIVINKSPEELMDMAGYVLSECHSEEEIQSYKKYYAKNEELCTFLGDRLDECRVFFAVKKNVDEIKRENFLNPLRQDEYGTSVISIQFTKDDSNTLSIKNRYNHRVDNPDSTFSNDLDNIIAGLTVSFEKYYGIIQKNVGITLEIPGYVRANDGKYYRYNYEINNRYYCADNIIIDNFRVVKFDKSKYLLIDYFILDLVNKKILLYDKYFKDAFTDSISDIKRIEIINIDSGKRIIIHGIDEKIEIEIDSFGNIIKMNMKNIKKIGNNFLSRNICLQEFKASQLEEVGNEFLYVNQMLNNIEVRNLRKAGNAMLFSNETLDTVIFPSLEEVGDDFLYWDEFILEYDLGKLKKAGSSFLAHYENRDSLLEELGIVEEKKRWNR